jgi:hypothetical protein
LSQNTFKDIFRESKVRKKRENETHRKTEQEIGEGVGEFLTSYNVKRLKS